NIQDQLAVNREGNRHEREIDRVMARVPQSRLLKGPYATSSSARQRKCVACESARGICPKCAEEESAQTRLRLTATIPVAQRRIDRGEGMGMEDLPVPMKGDGKRELKKEEIKCPTQTVTMSGAKRGANYGAVGLYCYGNEAKNWWFKEKVKNGSGPLCQPGDID